MALQNWHRAKEIFVETLRQKPAERAQFLDKICVGDAKMRREIESLIDSFDEAENFLEMPVVGEVADVMAPNKTQKPGKYFGHYEILELIGSGGMGEVYLARDKKLDRSVALKILSEKFSRNQINRSRFIQEAKTASALNHPNILTIHEINQENDIYFIVSEYIDGQTLRQIIEKSPIKLAEVLDISVQIANALCAAHEAQIVHRDLKPENIIVRPDGIVKILDFGLAKLVKHQNSMSGLTDEISIKNETAKGFILGTVNYMSPEQAKGEKITALTDIFSFGIVIYEMITGKTPFGCETISETWAKLLHTEPEPLSGVGFDFQEELQQIIFKMLKKKKTERFQTTQDLFHDLQGLRRSFEFKAQLNHSSTTNDQKEYKSQIFTIEIAEENEKIPPNNLSEQFKTIIGRETEIEEVRNLLLKKVVRLMTLTGIGGTGKTTLAKALARHMLSDFDDGVFYVELASVTNPELVASTIAQSLKIKEVGSKPILEGLKDYLRDKRMLLIVDNFEQVADAANQISDLLTNTGSQFKILITSRALLRVRSEREFIVPPLSLPTDSTQLSVDELLNYEAIKLFVEQAQNSKPNFSLTNENAQSVVGICSRLDGLPLAIELAAAHVKILSVAAIFTKLENRLKVLTGGSKDLPARQQTMRLAIEWSYDLLSEDEKRLFFRLSVFSGGFTFEAAEAVCSGFESDKKEIDFLEILTSLVDKSLIVSKEQASGEMRFRLLEVVREFALESLEANGQIEMMMIRHAEYFLALGEAAEPHLAESKAAEWFDCLEVEHDNLRSALQWLLDHNALKAARLAAAIRAFWILHNHLEGADWLKKILERVSLDLNTNLRWKLLTSLGKWAQFQGNFETALKAFEESLVVARTGNDLRQIVLSGISLSVVAYLQGNFTKARNIIEATLPIIHRLGDKYVIADSLSFLGDLARAEGDNATARLLIEECLTIFRQFGNKQAMCTRLNNLGAAAYSEGDFVAARSHFTESLTIVQELGEKSCLSHSLDGFAALAVKDGELEMAAKLLAAAEQLRESIGFEIQPADRLFRDNYTTELKTKMDAADFDEAYEQGLKLKLEEAFTLMHEIF